MKINFKKTFKQRGVTLIELIVFIVIVGVAVAGVLLTYDVVVKRSADPLVRKQALTAAESLLLEIEQKAFTWCDISDNNFFTATGYVTAGAIIGCATLPQNALGVVGQGGRANFDNVGDYHGYRENDVGDIGGGNRLTGYTASVNITAVGQTGAFAALPDANAALRIEVTVTPPTGPAVSVVGFRVRFAPNMP